MYTRSVRAWERRWLCGESDFGGRRRIFGLVCAVQVEAEVNAVGQTPEASMEALKSSTRVNKNQRNTNRQKKNQDKNLIEFLKQNKRG